VSDRAKPRDDDLRADRVDPRSDARWETYVAGQADALVYHHLAWLEVQRGLLTGRRLSSLPHAPLAGPLASNDAASATLLRAAIEEARACRAHLQIKASSANLGRLVEGLTAVPWEATYTRRWRQHPAEFGRASTFVRRAWQNVPLPVTAALGHLIYRYG